MIVAEVLESSLLRYKSPVSNLAKKLMRRMRPGRFYLEIYLVGNAFMKKNVLSFAAPKGFPRPDLKGFQSLGEIYINPKYIKEHGEDLSFMVIHGFLHLLGYDHEKKRDRIIMERLEKQLVSELTNS